MRGVELEGFGDTALSPVICELLSFTIQFTDCDPMGNIIIIIKFVSYDIADIVTLPSCLRGPIHC